MQVLSVLTSTATLRVCLGWCTKRIHGPRLIASFLSLSTLHSVHMAKKMHLLIAPYNLLLHNQVSNVIFLDSPVGTGFSYSGTEQGYQSNDTKAVNQILIFLKKVILLQIFSI